MDDKKLGVLGGMGPMATSVFFERVIKNTYATCDQEHIEMVILNQTSLPDRTMSIKNGHHEAFLNAVKKSFKVFEMLSVSHIAIPCNTSHYFYKAFEEMTHIPIINMIDKTVEALSVSIDPGSRIGVLGTDGTIKYDVYKESIEKRQMHYIAPDENTQKKVMDAIYNLKASKSSDMGEIELIIEEMVKIKACDKVILACIELSLLSIRDDLRVYCIDAMDILVKESIALSDKALNKDFLSNSVLSVS